MTPFASVPRRTIEFETATTGSTGKGPPGRPGKQPDRPGLRGDTGTHQRGKKEKGNGIKGKSSLNTKGGLGKGSTHRRECPGSGTGRLWVKHPGGDGGKGCRRGEGRLAGAEGWHFGSQSSTAALDRCVSLGGFDNQMGSAVSPGWHFSCQSHSLLL